MKRLALGLAYILLSVGAAAGAGGQQTPPAPSSGTPGTPVVMPSNAERIATAYDTRSHDYDLIHQRIELSQISWDSTSFVGRVTTTLVAQRPGLDSATLDAG